MCLPMSFFSGSSYVLLFNYFGICQIYCLDTKCYYFIFFNSLKLLILYGWNNDPTIYISKYNLFFSIENSILPVFFCLFYP